MTESSITKIQREVLEAAARRNDYAAWPIRGSKLNIGSATRVIKELMRRGMVVEVPAIAKAPVWREGGDGRALMAVISDDGLGAIGMAPIGRKARSSRSTEKKAPLATDKAPAVAVSLKVPRMPRAGTKLAVLVELLAHEEGATIEEMAAATEWQAHSLRGVMSGMLSKKLGLEIGSEKAPGEDRVYRLNK